MHEFFVLRARGGGGGHVPPGPRSYSPTKYLTMDYPLPLGKSIIGPFLHACLCDLLPNGGSLTTVDVHGWCVSTATQ